MAQDALWGALSCLLCHLLDVIIFGSFLPGACQIHDRHVGGGQTEGHASELPIQLRDDLAHSFGSISGYRHDVPGNPTTITAQFPRGAIHSLLGGSDGLQCGHESLHNAKVVKRTFVKGARQLVQMILRKLSYFLWFTPITNMGPSAEGTELMTLLPPLFGDAQTRQLQDAVTNVEKHFGELCQIFAAYVRKTARLRDKADLLVNEINVYASTETPHLKQGLKNFADEFAKLQDYRQAEVERLEAKVVEPLKAYGTIVRMKRDDLKATLTAKNREAKQLSQLERTRQRNPSDRHIIAETELQRATMDATRTTRHLEETIDNFEKQKIKDIKTIFSEFITIEMLFHGKALEVYTAAYQNIQKIDEDEDLEVFRNSLYPQDYSSRLDIVRANSKSPLQRSLSAKCVSGTGQIATCRLRKDQQADDDEDDEDLDVTEEDQF
ncbi:Protein FAM92A1 [Sciurus carolinensis]|uniref:Protein FAM92A1 n=1 Tax=Sciurus carolinensis TaxID=30640 RepID=A0AA41SQ77_SCICA|nr:Protein FAM92A1 [Sciurus carolinensis]